MAVSAIGLKTYIWNNELRAFALLAAYPLLICLLVFAWTYLGLTVISMEFDDAILSNIRHEHPPLKPLPPNPPELSAVWALLLPKAIPVTLLSCLLWFIVAHHYHDRIFMKLIWQREPTEAERQRVERLLQPLCISRGLTAPRLRMIDHPGGNAFTSGLAEGNYTVNLSTGLLVMLDDAELETVLAHEVTHILNGDVKLLMIFVIFVHAFEMLAARLVTLPVLRTRKATQKAVEQERLRTALAAYPVSQSHSGRVLPVLRCYLHRRFPRIFRKRRFLLDGQLVELTSDKLQAYNAMYDRKFTPPERKEPGLGPLRITVKRNLNDYGPPLPLVPLWWFLRSARLVTWVLRLMLSRRREYLADMGAVELTKRPEALISALIKLHDNPMLYGLPVDVRAMGIVDDISRASLFSLHASHPPLDLRVEAIQMHAMRGV